jgi:glycosyltransferase involved in cell wall biosynthesis
VFVLPSYNEGMSVALLEALAAALPVVVTETGGTAELVKDNGLIVPWADPSALADALETFLYTPQVCREMGWRSRQIAEMFSWEATAQAYVDLCHGLLADQP